MVNKSYYQRTAGKKYYQWTADKNHPGRNVNLRGDLLEGTGLYFTIVPTEKGIFRLYYIKPRYLLHCPSTFRPHKTNNTLMNKAIIPLIGNTAYCEYPGIRLKIRIIAK